MIISSHRSNIRARIRTTNPDNLGIRHRTPIIGLIVLTGRRRIHRGTGIVDRVHRIGPEKSQNDLNFEIETRENQKVKSKF